MAFNGSDRNRLRLETGTFYGKSFAVLRASSLLLSELEDIDNCLEWAKKGVMSLHSSFMCAVHAQFQAVLNPREIFFRRSQAIILWVCIVDTFDIGELFLPPSFFMLVWRSWEMRRSFRFLSLSINTRQDQFSWEKSNNQKDNKFSLRKRNKQRKIKSIPSFSQEKKVTNDHHFDSKQKMFP